MTSCAHLFEQNNADDESERDAAHRARLEHADQQAREVELAAFLSSPLQYRRLLEGRQTRRQHDPQAARVT